MLDIQVAFDKLAQFETPEEIAAFLSEYDIKGIKSVSRKCPLATWVKENTGVSVTVGPYSMHTWDGKAFVNTDAMHSFVNNFDSGAYPDLQDEYIYSSRISITP